MLNRISGSSIYSQSKSSKKSCKLLQNNFISVHQQPSFCGNIKKPAAVAGVFVLSLSTFVNSLFFYLPNIKTTRIIMDNLKTLNPIVSELAEKSNPKLVEQSRKVMENMQQEMDELQSKYTFFGAVNNYKERLDETTRIQDKFSSLRREFPQGPELNGMVEIEKEIDNNITSAKLLQNIAQNPNIPISNSMLKNLLRKS